MICASHFMQGPSVSHSRRLIPKPEVSIVLPTYSRGDSGLLKRAIESVLRQKFQNFELIVMDDGSTDSTASVISEFVEADDRVIHVRHDRNCGLPALRVNEGLLMARGAYCAYQFDDDQWTAEHLETMMRQFRGNARWGVAYGLCRYTIAGHDHLLGHPFDYSKLISGNYIANNSVVHRREVFERLGGYDMHVLMRRLCDWDLWLRWGRNVKFCFVDEVVSLVEAGRAESIGATAPYDSFATRAHMALDRTANLLPEALSSFVVDDLGHLNHLGTEKISELWLRHIAPFQSRFPDVWVTSDPPRPKRIHVLVTKAHFDTTVDITISNFKEALAREFVFTFIPQGQIDEAAVRSSDILLLHRTIDSQAVGLAETARRAGKAVVFLMDDDLLSLHELSEEFSYLAPGSACRQSLESIIKDADLTVTYSRLMQEAVQGLNLRNVRLDTNIRGKWLASAKSRLNSTVEDGQRMYETVKIGFAGYTARREEFEVLWPAIVEASHSLGARAEFHFWGLQPDRLNELGSPFRLEPFTFSYDQYLEQLTTADFDVMLAPLFAEKKAKRAKCPIKFLESTAAGAIGVYSDVEPYQVVEDGVTGIKCENVASAWCAAILKAAALSHPERMRMLAQAIRRVEDDYASEGQASRVAATLKAALLHSRLPHAYSQRPRIAYFCHSPYLAGAENHLLRHAMLALEFRFEPVLVLPASCSAIHDEMQRRAEDLGIEVAYLPLSVETELSAERVLDESMVGTIQHWLERSHIALVHSVTIMREPGEATRRLNLPHAVSLYAAGRTEPAGVDHCDVVHSDSLLYANRWAGVLGVPARRILSHIPDAYFMEKPARTGSDDGREGEPVRIAVFGTLQPRKGQLQAIEAVGLLRKETARPVHLHLFGYDHFFPNYMASCVEMAEKYGVSEFVHFEGFVRDPRASLQAADILLCASDWESLPQAILEGMAAGLLVVAPNVGGITDVVSNRTGILMEDNSASSIRAAVGRALALCTADWKQRTTLARSVVRRECSTFAVASELFSLYEEAAKARKLSAGPRNRPAPIRSEAISETLDRIPSTDLTYAALDKLRSRLREINAEL
jgi:glycosyltransferase involved in cell wall biosynthesis